MTSPSNPDALFLTYKDLISVRSPRDLFSLLQSKEINPQKIVELLNYENELQKLQIELVKLQRWVQEKKRRVAILFEGRDAADGKEIKPRLTLLDTRDAVAGVAFPYFGGQPHPHFFPGSLDQAIRESCLQPAKDVRTFSLLTFTT